MLSMGSFFPYLILSGIIWPLEGMSFFMRWISYFLPQTLPIMSLRNIMLKGWGITETFVWLGFVATFAWIIVFLVVTTVMSSLCKS